MGLLQQPADVRPPTSAAAALYNASWRHLLHRTFDELPDDRQPDGGDRWWEVVRPLLDEPGVAVVGRPAPRPRSSAATTSCARP